MEITPKTVAETIPITFNYQEQMRGDAIASVVITIEDEYGVAQPSMLVGVATLHGRKAVQLVSGGILGRRYYVKCLATFTKNPAVLELVAEFTVVDETP